MSSTPNKRQVSVAVLMAGVVIVLFGVVLAAGHILPAAPTQAQSNHPITTPDPDAGTPYPHAPGPIPTIGPLPTRSPSCPITHTGYVYGNPGEKMPIELPLPPVGGKLVKGFIDSGAVGMITGVFYYQLTAGEVEEPESYQGLGFISVDFWYVDGCAADQAATPFPSAPKGAVYLTPGKDGAVIFTSISGAVVSYKTTDGTTGSFDYVTGKFQS